MNEQGGSKPKVGLVTFTDGRDSFFDLPRETYLRRQHQELIQFLTDNGCEVVDPMAELRPDPNDWFGVRRYGDAAYCARYLQSAGAERISGARLVLIPRCGHFVQFEKPEETNSEVLKFFAGS